MKKESALYIVATPIGNLADISLRALEVFAKVAAVAAEDTRHTAKLLAHHAIDVPLLSYHDHGGTLQVQRIIDRLDAGDALALVSDAGTPLICDPGYRLVNAVRDAGHTVVPVPGACALVAALSAAGIPSDRFIFEGFAPAKKVARLSLFSAMRQESRTVIFYESTHRIQAALADMMTAFGATRRAALARELTKTYETFLVGSLDSLSAQLAENHQQRKGEFVVMLEGYRGHEDNRLSANAQKTLTLLLQELPLKQAVSLAAKICDEKKNTLYQWALSQQ